MQQEIGSMLEKHAIEETTPRGRFLSTIFLVPKKVGGQRLVINLKSLHSYAVTVGSGSGPGQRQKKTCDNFPANLLHCVIN